jgi:hypothetical protein
MSTRTVMAVIGVCRAAGGAAAYFRPDAFARYGKVEEAGTSVDSRYVTRPFGARDIVIGAATVAGPGQGTALWMGAVCDGLDTVSGLLAGKDGKDVSWVRAASALTTLFTIVGLAAGVRNSQSR